MTGLLLILVNISEVVFMSALTDSVAGLVAAFVEENGMRLWDVEFKKEGADYYLRVYIDRDGGIGIEDCQKVNDYLSPLLDELDPIEQSYYLEISSAGLIRELRRDAHYSQFIGSPVSVRTYRSVEGLPKKFEAVLERFDKDTFTFRIGDREVTVRRGDVSGMSVDLT